MNNQEKVFSFDDPNENLGYLLWQVTMLWQRKMKNGLDRIGITHTQFALMAALEWQSMSKPEVSQIDIANHAKVDRMMTSKVLKSLAEKGLVYSKVSVTDSRAKAVSLTEQGEAIFKQALKIVEQMDADFFAEVEDQQVVFRGLMLALLN